VNEFLEGVGFSFKGSKLFYEDKTLECENEIIDVCLGKYGDGCGGGRIFILFASCLKVYDLESQNFMELRTDFKNAKSIHKKACDLFISVKGEDIIFNLSTMEQRTVELKEIS